jgi:hypothetical protein
VTTDTLPESVTEPPAKERGHRVRIAVITLVLLLVAGGIGLRVLWPDRGADVRAGTELVTNEGLEAAYGLRITLLGVTAAGGMIDFRYEVVDPEKANPVIHDIDLFPKLVVEETGVTLALRSLPHSHNATLELGGNYFFLLPNARNAVHEGSAVTLVIGDVRLEHLIVQG